jgi:hypothetical protein
MRESNNAEPHYDVDASVEADILAFFSSDTAAAIRQYTCTALASDLNISSEALEQIIADKPPGKTHLGIRFFTRRLHQFA